MTTQTTAPPPIPLTIQSTRRFTVNEYYLMAEAGILHENDRVELIDGRIVEMAPIGSHHAGCVAQLNRLFSMLAAGVVFIWPQNPIHIGDNSEPEPDIALLRPRADFYTASHPGPADILLLIEVSDSSIIYDRNVKVPLYARAGIIEIWLVNLEANCIEVYREPGAPGYQQSLVLRRGDTITPQALPDITLNVSDILPPVAEETAASQE